MIGALPRSVIYRNFYYISTDCARLHVYLGLSVCNMEYPDSDILFSVTYYPLADLAAFTEQ